MKLLLYLAPLLFLLGLTGAAPPTFVYHFCSEMVNRSYQSSLNSVLSSLSSNTTRTRFNSSSSSVPASGQTIEGLYQCRGDLSLDTCNNCVNFATNDLLQRCPNNTGAIVWYEECLLHFSNESIFSVINTDPYYLWWNPNRVAASERVQYNSFVRAVLSGIIIQARTEKSSFLANATSTKGSISDVDQIYSLVQCTEDLSADDCQSCLQQAIMRLPDCCNGTNGGRVLFPSCFFRYEQYLFYNSNGVASPPPPPSPPPTVHQSGKESTVTIVAIVASIGASLIMILIAVYFFLLKRQTKNVDAGLGGEAYKIEQLQSLQFDFETVKLATNNFSDESKLGQGGFGAIYKGTLPNGQDIAVKRLSTDSMQGESEFKNEVLLLAKLHHRNLVRIVGFCFHGEERLLLYEFLPNSSLDRHLFDHVRRENMEWTTRHKIIGGIARGILYLHEDSRLRIIHRDLKASNVLLDEEMNPKISDFGMARLFAMDQTQANTNRVVGTFGYMAPEYVTRGRFSVKSDVFSFGVLVLEIASGIRNNGLHIGEEAEDLLTFAWRNWQEGTPTNIIDQGIRRGSMTEMIRWIHIALLCVQENEAERPTMAQVFVMLNSYSLIFPVPSRPAFFMHTTRDDQDESEGRFVISSQNEASMTDPFPR